MSWAICWDIDEGMEFPGLEANYDFGSLTRAEAREKIAEIARSAGYSAEVVATNPHEVAITNKDGLEAVYMVDED